MGRAVTLATLDRLYRSVNRMAGLRRLEDPVFGDQLRIAQQAGRSGPGRLVNEVLDSGQALLMISGFLGTLLLINPWMAALVLVAAVPAMAAQLRLGRARAAMTWRVSPRERREEYYAELMGSLAAAKEVRLLGLGGLFRTRMLHELSAVHTAEATQDRRDLAAHGSLSFLTTAVAGAGLLWAVWTASRGQLTVGDLAVFVAATAGVQGGLQTLVYSLAGAYQSMLLFRHYRDVECAGPDLAVPSHPQPVPRLRDGIRLSGVWFRYGGDQPWVLRDVNLTIPAGTATALVGLNGAGKSTLIKLLCRFYDPDRGAISWDGVDLRDLDLTELRERIGAVFQDAMAYDLSAAENIGIGDVGVLDDHPRIVAAAVRADVHDRLRSLPRGYDTLLSTIYHPDGDDPGPGVLLSGGQWQRVALARAFLRDRRDLMILDEPSTGLDAEAEYDLHHRMRAQRTGATSVLISHRLGAVRDADRIVVLSDGAVVEEGNHDELLTAGGRYARLYRLQASGYGADGVVTV